MLSFDAVCAFQRCLVSPNEKLFLRKFRKVFYTRHDYLFYLFTSFIIRRKMRSKLKFNVRQFVEKYFLSSHAVNFSRTGWPILERPMVPKKDFHPPNFDSELLA
nr:PREDICTED: uncharacterized protein LOC109042877 [Bemisia tabaci]